MPTAPSGTNFTSVSIAGAWRQKDLGSAKRLVTWSRQTYGNVGEASWSVLGSNDQVTWYIVDRQTGRNTTARTETGTVSSNYSQYSYRYYRWVTEAMVSGFQYIMNHIYLLRDENGNFLTTDDSFTQSTGAGDVLPTENSTIFSVSGGINWQHSDNYLTTGVYTGPTTTLAYDPTLPQAGPPSAPTSLAAVSAGSQSVSISFTAGSDGGSAITNYQYSIDNGTSYTAASPAVTSSPIVISGLVIGQTYNIKLKAVNSSGAGAASSAVSYTVAAAPVQSANYVNTGTQFSKSGIVVSYTDDSGAAVTQNVTFANKTLTMDSGLNVSAGNANFAGAAEIHGAAQLDSTLDVVGAGRFHSALVVDGAFTMGNSLNVAGAATMGSTLAVAGATNLNNTLAVAGAASMASTLAVTGAANLNNTLAVAGAANLNNTLAVAGAASLNNSLAVAGAASLNSSLAVLGATTLTGALDVKAASHLENTLLVDGAASLGAALTVTGATTLNNGMTVNGTSTHNGALVVSGASSVSGALGVTGAVTLNSALDVKGASHLEDILVVDGAASLGSSLAVAGAASVTGAMDVTGASHLHNSVVVDGAASMGSTLAVSGAASMASTLDVTGASHLRNNMVVDGAASLGSSLAVTGAASMANTLAVTGATNLNNTLAVSGAASLNNSLAVAGAASLNSTLAVTGAANLNNTLAVSGAASLNNSLAVAGAASLNSSLAVSGASSMGSTLAVSGAATFQNNVTVNGNLTVLGSQTAIDTTSLQVKDNAILLADGNAADVLASGIQLQYKPSGAAAVKYAGVKRQPTTGEFVFFKDSAKMIDDPSMSGVASTTPYAGEYATVDVGSSVQISLYALSEYSNNINFAAWSLVGSNDKSSWYLIDSKDNQNLPNYGPAQQFNVSTSAYRYYRLIVQKYRTTDIYHFYRFGFAMKDMSGNFLTGTKSDFSPSWTFPAMYGGDSAVQIGLNTTFDIGSVGPSLSGGYERLAENSALFNGPNNAYSGSVVTNVTVPAEPVPADVYATVMADSFNSASDARLKKDIVPLEGVLDKIDAIRGVHYHWIDGEQSQSRQVGVIAQEIQAVYPELVMEGCNGYLSVDYPKLTAVLIESIKELKAMAIALINK